jgi:hypothetical protein
MKPQNTVKAGMKLATLLVMLALTTQSLAAGDTHWNADADQDRRTRIFSSLPDWSGFWEAEAWSDITVAGRPAGGIAAVRAKSTLSAIPPYNEEWKARYEEARKSPAAQAAALSSKFCEFGFPGVMESPATLQFVVTPEETLIVSVTREIRHIPTTGEPHPPKEERWPTLLGTSVGHWEGQTLVVSTIERQAEAPLRFSTPYVKLSEHARFTERIRRVSRDRLEIEMTVEDPVALTRPWRIPLSYRRVTNLDRMIYHNCTENDRNPIVDGKLTISAPAANPK